MEEIIIVTNQKFHQQFVDWKSQYKDLEVPFEIVNDGSTSDADKLGAIGDLHLTIRKRGIKSDLLVIAGDNLFENSIVPFVQFAQENHSAVLGLYDVKSLEAIKQYSAITLGDDGVIAHFEEKPKNPQTTMAGIALYYYPAEVVGLVNTYIATGNNPDQPGRFVQWLYPRVPVMGKLIEGAWYDIGTHETLAEADQIFTARLAK